MMADMGQVLELFSVAPETLRKLAWSAGIVGVLVGLRSLACWVARRRVDDVQQFYHLRRVILNTVTLLGVLLVARVWILSFGSLATFLGLMSAGLAVAMHDTIANFTGWLFIVWRKPFTVGDRIQIGENSGDVIDVRMFEFSLIEIGRWVDADQSTGRIVHVPNSRVLREPLHNYETGFKYIWHEIPVLITFESNWRKAKELLTQIAVRHAEHLSVGAEEQIRLAAMKYLIFFKKLTPIVYTSVRDSGVLLTLRYIVKPRERRGSEQVIWEAILDAFAEAGDISLAYPTRRLYRADEGAAHSGGQADGHRL
jgi:small-conductance mechanosensitive channel